MNEKLNISIILPGGGRSGGVRSTVLAANGLIHRGHRVRLLVYKRPWSLRAMFRGYWHRLCYPKNNDWLDLYERPIHWFRDIREVCFEKNEVVLASCWWASTEIRKLQDPNLCKVHHVRGVMPNPADMTRAFGENVPKIVIASYLIPVMEQTCGQTPVAVVHNGIDLKSFYPAVPHELCDGVGTIFANSYPKDPESIISILDKLRTLAPETPQRVFGYFPRPAAIPSRNYWRFPSPDKIRQLYSQSRVWFLASRSEGFSNPVLEAMACGCAVVSTDCGGPRDMIEDDVNGYLVPVGDVNAAVEKICYLLKNPQMCHKMSKNNIGKVKQFSWDMSISKLETVLLDVNRSYHEHLKSGTAENPTTSI